MELYAKIEEIFYLIVNYCTKARLSRRHRAFARIQNGRRAFENGCGARMERTRNIRRDNLNARGDDLPYSMGNKEREKRKRRSKKRRKQNDVIKNYEGCGFSAALVFFLN